MVDLRELHRAVDRRVGREHLLDERRAGSRQADDEDRGRIRMPPARSLRKEVRREQFLALGDDAIEDIR